MYVATEGFDSYVVVDGEAGPAHDQIGELTVSPDGGRVAYVASNLEGETFLVLDGERGASYGAIYDVTFAVR